MSRRLLKLGRPVALVTGAGRRLGRQVAIALAKQGYDLVINYNQSTKGLFSKNTIIISLYA